MQIAHHGLAAAALVAGKGQQRFAGMHQITVGYEQGGDGAILGGRDINNGLGGFHAEQQIIHLHGVTFLHVPLDHFRFLQTFAQIGQGEVGHGILPF